MGQMGNMKIICDTLSISTRGNVETCNISVVLNTQVNRWKGGIYLKDNQKAD